MIELIPTCCRARKKLPNNSKLALRQAKLLFRDDRKPEAAQVCKEILSSSVSAPATSVHSSAPASSQAQLPDKKPTSFQNDTADAHYILGAVKVKWKIKHLRFTVLFVGCLAESFFACCNSESFLLAPFSICFFAALLFVP